MARFTLGEKGRRYKWNLYAFGIVLLILLATCRVCKRFDWHALSRRQDEQKMIEVEDKVLLRHQPHGEEVYALASECGRWLRDRWMAGYLYDQVDGKEYFIGRMSPDFRKAVEAQKDTIRARKPVDTSKIPEFRFTVEFKRLKCWMVVGGTEPPNIGRDEAVR